MARSTGATPLRNYLHVPETDLPSSTVEVESPSSAPSPTPPPPSAPTRVLSQSSVIETPQCVH